MHCTLFVYERVYVLSCTGTNLLWICPGTSKNKRACTLGRTSWNQCAHHRLLKTCVHNINFTDERACTLRTPNVRAECCSTTVHSFPLTLRSLTKSWSVTLRSLLSTKPPLTNDDFFREPGKCQHPNTKKEIYFYQI